MNSVLAGLLVADLVVHVLGVVVAAHCCEAEEHEERDKDDERDAELLIRSLWLQGVGDLLFLIFLPLVHCSPYVDDL